MEVQVGAARAEVEDVAVVAETVLVDVRSVAVVEVVLTIVAVVAVEYVETAVLVYGEEVSLVS